MTPREEYAFAQGLALGIALCMHHQQEQMASLAQRVQRVERGEGELRSVLRVLRYLVPMGWRDGHRIYRFAKR
jgi:hypothetical protein